MKIRTDFVTNSSSSSFVTVYITTKQGKSHWGGYDSGDNSILGEDGFEKDKEYFENLSDINTLIEDVAEWFADTFADPTFPEEYDYTTGELKSIKAFNLEDIEEIEVTSGVNFDDLSIGCEISYDYTTKEYSKRDTGYNWEEEEEDYI